MARLEHFAARESLPPVLFYQTDGDLLLISRNRERLAEHFSFVLASRELVETAMDKGRFAVVAGRLGLPVPASRQLSPRADVPHDIDLAFPLIVKPLTRRHELWSPIGGHAKAVRVDSPPRLADLWRRFPEDGADVLVQEEVPGPESRIESYHAYVDEDGEVVGEFTGRKIRTHPLEYGRSTALETTLERDVRDVGREVVGRLGLRGVTKVDFKRAPSGVLRLLEVNPRFNLWHHLGAVAGVNLPAAVYADLTGSPRPPLGAVRAGVRWSLPRDDLRAGREIGMPAWRWAAWTLRARAKSGVAWDSTARVGASTLSCARASADARVSTRGHSRHGPRHPL